MATQNLTSSGTPVFTAVTLGAETLETSDITKLDGVDAGATDDQTGAEIKTAYEAESDTNAYTDTEKTLLSNQSGTNTGDATYGIANTNAVMIDGADITSAEYAKFTINGLESKTFAEVKADLSLSNVDDTSDATKDAATATLSNKTLTLPQINDTSSDHQYVFAVSELTANRTVTLPLLTTNDEWVFKDHAQTLTNKTLTSPIINSPSSSGEVYGSTYSAAASDIVNLDGTPASHTAQFMRVGSIVTVSGVVTIDPTTTATLTEFQLALPIASNMTAIGDLAGSAAKYSSGSTVIDAFEIYADATNDKARFIGYPIGVDSDTCTYTYTYQIK